jgi:DNA-binding NtrC family response regulator
MNVQYPVPDTQYLIPSTNTEFSMNEKILIIDHEPDILSTLEAILTKEGYQVRSASGSEEAISVSKSGPLDLVIMDIRMPGMDGLNFMRQLKKLDDNIEVIVLTGSPSIENAVKALRDDGAFDFLTKPLENVDQLINSVREALQKHRLYKKELGTFQEAKTGQ